MKKNTTAILLCIAIAFTLSSCGGPAKDKNAPDVLPFNEISGMTEDINIENNEAVIEKKNTDMSDKAIEMEQVTLVSEELYRDAYYGVPVKIRETYYKIPAVRIMNYYFIEQSVVSSITGLEIVVLDNSISIRAPEHTKIDTTTLEEGSINAEAISVDDVALIADEEKLIIRFRGKDYISLLTLSEYMKDEQFFFDRDIGAITTTMPNIGNHPNLNPNGLLRKSVSIDETKELVARDSSYGKMIVVYDVYGLSLDITPNDITYAIDLQSIFFHKTDETIYMFGLTGNSVSMYTINIDEEYNIAITPLGSVQRAAQNIYYLNNQYICVGRNDIFGVAYDKENDTVYEVNMKDPINIQETGGDFNIIDGKYYLTVKDPNGSVIIYQLAEKAFTLGRPVKLDMSISVDAVQNNFFYSFVEDGKIAIYLMENGGYIYCVTYDFESGEIEELQTDVFRLFYSEETFPVELAINLVKANETGDSEVSLTINNVYLGNNIILYGIEDNWVYCSEYLKNGDAYAVYSFRYNAITGVRDYSNLT